MPDLYLKGNKAGIDHIITVLKIHVPGYTG